MTNRVQKFFTLLGLLKYGIVLSLLLIYLPLTAVFMALPGYDIAGNMFVELSAAGVFLAMIFLLAVAWSIMVVEGLIVNGSENRFDKSLPAYRSLRTITKAQQPQDKHIPHWGDVFFAIPVTGWQFLSFTILLAGPSFAIIVWHADRPVLAFFVAMAAFVIDYLVFVLLCTPVALIDPDDPPLNDFPLVETIWSRFGYRTGAASQNTRAYRFSLWLQRRISAVVWKLRLTYLLDQKGLIYPVHFLAVVIVTGLLAFWIAFDWAAYPGGTFDVESAPVVYVYASLLLFVWLFAGLNFHLGRLHISSIAALLIFVLIGYQIFSVDHEYKVTRAPSNQPPLTPVDVAKNSTGGPNLVVVASAGGGIWAAGWTGLALEKLVGARPELTREIRLLSTVSGGSVGAAHYVYGLLNDQTYQNEGKLGAETLRNVRVKSVSSSLEAVAYGVAFRDFPRFITGGIYHPTLDRGDLLEREWARIAAGTVAASVEGKNKREYLVEKGSEDAGKCWAGGKQCGFLDLRAAIIAGSVPALIFNATVMELGRRVMITPLDFAANVPGRERGQTLQDFLFADPKSGVASARASLPLWTAARLSATFSFVSPAVRTNVSNKGKEEEPNLWKQHLVDGGYYDNFGVASALDWLQPVLESRREGKDGLNFSRVLIVQLRGFAGVPEEQIKPSPGAKAALIGPLDALFSIREGVAVSRDVIDVDRFLEYWNRELAGKVRLETVEFVPDSRQTAGPLSWHLTESDIQLLKTSWGKSDEPNAWNDGIRKNWCKLSEFLGSGPGRGCDGATSVGRGSR